MRFLVDGDLPRSVDNLLQKYNHEVVDIRDVGFGGAKDHLVANYAQKERLCLLTGDFDFSDVRNYPPREYSGLVVLKLPRNATTSFILNLLESFLQREDLLVRIPGKLAIVEPGRVRIRKA